MWPNDQPKVEYHRHFGGSITPEITWVIIQHTKQHHIAGSLQEVRESLTYSKSEKGDFQHFLTKFKLLDRIRWCEWSVDYSIDRVCYSLRSENIDRAILSVSINKYISDWWPAEEVLDYIIRCFKFWGTVYKVQVDILFSLKYENSLENNLGLLFVAGKQKYFDYLGGIDLVGDEKFFNSEIGKHLGQWQEAGKIIRAHTNELECDNTTLLAINDIGVNRIAHGIFATPDAFKLAIDRGIIFDLAITSNLVTGAVKELSDHPIKNMMDLGCRVTLSTDDPVQLDTTLGREFELASEITGLSWDDLASRFC